MVKIKTKAETIIDIEDMIDNKLVGFTENQRTLIKGIALQSYKLGVKDGSDFIYIEEDVRKIDKSSNKNND